VTPSFDLNLGNFLFEFNHLRKHGGLNYETPFDKLRKVAELLSQYSFPYFRNVISLELENTACFFISFLQ